MQQDIASTTDAETVRGADFEMIEQRENVHGGVLMAERFRKNARPAMAAEIGDDQLEIFAPLAGQCFPILAGAGETMQQKQRLAGSMNLEVEFDAVEGRDGAGRLVVRHLGASLGLWCPPKTKTPTRRRGRS